MKKQYNTISFGGGIQSTTMFYMACLGLIKPKPDFAVFADTGWERKDTYKNIERCQKFGEEHNIPIHIVQSVLGDIRRVVEDKKFIGLPFFVNSQRLIDKGGYKVVSPKKPRPIMLPRQCTYKYKITPITSFIRKTTGCNLHNPVTSWIGISLDEIQRMKKSEYRHTIFRYPLIEQRISRQDCINWLKENNFPIPVRSSCIGCPFHTEREWRELSKEEFKEACDFDDKARKVGMAYKEDMNEKGSYLSNDVYLHSSLRPLKERPFKNENLEQLNLFETKDTTCDEGGCFL